MLTKEEKLRLATRIRLGETWPSDQPIPRGECRQGSPVWAPVQVCHDGVTPGWSVYVLGVHVGRVFAGQHCWVWQQQLDILGEKYLTNAVATKMALEYLERD